MLLMISLGANYFFIFAMSSACRCCAYSNSKISLLLFATYYSAFSSGSPKSHGKARSSMLPTSNSVKKG
jgi:hypothetical protein